MVERDIFIESNLGLVHSLCKRFRGRGIEYDDLYQAGCVGLVKAADAFDEQRGLCFSTYAVPVILGEIRRLFRDGGSVKVSRSVKELSMRVNRTREKMEMSLGREVTVSELAQELEVTVEEITDAICVSQPVISLTYEDDDGVSELDLPTVSTEDELADRLVLDEAFAKLNDTERSIIMYRYYNYFTQSRTAELMNMSQVQISRAEKRILSKLRGILM